MNSGHHFISSLEFNTISLNGTVFKNHCSALMNSTGVLQRQQTPTFCSSGLCAMSRSFFCKSSITSLRASSIFIPLYLPQIAVMQPSSSILISMGNLYLKTQFRSSLSPTVHIITIPDPNSGSTTSSSTIFTSLLNKGTFNI